MADLPKWDEPGNELSSKPDEAGHLARLYQISVDRAQMLIDRHGHDPARLQAAAERLRSGGAQGKPGLKGPGPFVV